MVFRDFFFVFALFSHGNTYKLKAEFLSAFAEDYGRKPVDECTGLTYPLLEERKRVLRRISLAEE